MSNLFETITTPLPQLLKELNEKQDFKDWAKCEECNEWYPITRLAPVKIKCEKNDIEMEICPACYHWFSKTGYI